MNYEFEWIGDNCDFLFELYELCVANPIRVNSWMICVNWIEMQLFEWKFYELIFKPQLAWQFPSEILGSNDYLGFDNLKLLMSPINNG